VTDNELRDCLARFVANGNAYFGANSEKQQALATGLVVSDGEAAEAMIGWARELAQEARRRGCERLQPLIEVAAAWHAYERRFWIGLPAAIEELRSTIGTTVTSTYERLSEAEKNIFNVIEEAGGVIESQAAVTSALEAKFGPTSEGTTKTTLAALVRHGLLQSGPEGRGYRLPTSGIYQV
jgi:hypothetical protein